MAPRKPKVVLVEFPPDKCGGCKFFNDELCWSSPPIMMTLDDSPTWTRGAPAESEWPACKDFQPRKND